jgi:hypothetical protein
MFFEVFLRDIKISNPLKNVLKTEDLLSKKSKKKDKLIKVYP